MQWEYKTQRFEVSGLLKSAIDTDKFDGALHQLGREGWELVTMMYIDAELRKAAVFGVFKRPAGERGAETRGACPRCSYDLRGADHAVCPECGWSVEG